MAYHSASSLLKLKNIFKLFACLLLTFSAGIIGSLAASSVDRGWYESLERPFFNPPSEVFAPIWVLLYTITAVSLYLVLTTPFEGSKINAYRAFGIQLILNTTWLLVFFGLESPLLTILTMVAMIVAIVCTIRLFWPISKAAGLLLVPYLAWISFSTALTIGIAMLN